MPSIRRYGPALVQPQVSPRPELGRGREQTFAAFQQVFEGANAFIRPAVEQVQTARGEQEALASVDETGPEFGLERRRPETAIDLVLGNQAQPSARNILTGQGARRPGPTNENASILEAFQGELVPGLANIDYSQIGTRDDPLDPDVIGNLNGVIRQLGPGIDVRVTSGGQPPAGAAGPGERTGSDRHDHGSAADIVLMRDGNAVTPAQEPELYEQFFNLAAPHFPGMGHYDWGVHVGGGSTAFWGPDTTGATADPRFARAAAAGRRGAYFTAQVADGAGAADYELRVLNENTFEPRMPFTVRDIAFNHAADRVIGARAQSALEEGMRIAQARADGDLTVLREEMARVQSRVMAELPKELPGLATELQATYERSRLVAERQAIDLAQRRVFQQQETALSGAVDATMQEAERLALTGGTAAELADHMAQATDMLAQFGPREGFEIAGRVYPPDPTRAGTMTADALASNMATISTGSRRLMIEADFMRSGAPGQYVEEFRNQVFAGNSPLPAGESLDLLRTLQSRANTTESARRTAAEAERRRLEQGMSDTINAYVSMGDAGVPVAIPQEERARIISALSPFPDLQREARLEFAVADAQVQTHGMSGDQLMGYVERIRGDMTGAVERGELDLAGAAIIGSLQDRISQVQDAVTAETIGLPMIEQLIASGGTADEVDYDGLREQAAGNADVLNAIAEVEAFHRDVETMGNMSAAEREAVLENGRQAMAELAATGEGYGASALITQRVTERLSEWSEHRREMAGRDPVQFANSIGVDLSSFEGVETMTGVGTVLTQRINALSPHTAMEGFDTTVPLTRAEIEGISDIFLTSSRPQRVEFLGMISELGEDQAMAVFESIGQSEPVLYAAGAVYSMGNQQAAGVILRGAVDTRLEGGSPLDVATSRERVLAPLLTSDMIAGEGIAQLDATALAYARGLAIAAGGRAITANDIEEGYGIALGRQADGTGGLAETRYGPTLLPPGWDERRTSRAIRAIDDEQLTQIARGLVVDRFDRVFSAESLERSIEGLRPSPDNPYVLVPIDADGNVFLTDDGNVRGVLTFDLSEFP
jgi:hypothetical protein